MIQTGIWHISVPKCGVISPMVKYVQKRTLPWVERVRQGPRRRNNYSVSSERKRIGSREGGGEQCGKRECQAKTRGHMGTDGTERQAPPGKDKVFRKTKAASEGGRGRGLKPRAWKSPTDEHAV